MRICVYTSDIDQAPVDRATLLAKTSSFLRENKVDEVFIASHRYPKSGLGGNKYYIFEGYDKPKVTLCRRFLRVIDAMRGIPPFFAAIPLRLCEREIIESLLAFDPDVIGVLNLRWGRQLQELLKRHHPQWICLKGPEQKLDTDRTWRKYDPSVKVSIVLPTYDGSKYFGQSIESCLNQTFKNIELIIVDDGSAEDIPRIVGAYNDPRIKYLRHERNQGLPRALNTGFRDCSGEYLTWTSDDNYYKETAIEEMVGFLQTYPKVDFVYAESHVLDERGTYQGARITRNKPPQWLEVNNGVGACFLYKRKVYEVIGDYDATAVLAEDYDYWVRISKGFRMQRLNKTLYYYRWHGDSLTSKYSPGAIAEKVKLVKQLNNIRTVRDR